MNHAKWKLCSVRVEKNIVDFLLLSDHYLNKGAQRAASADPFSSTGQEHSS